MHDVQRRTLPIKRTEERILAPPKKAVKIWLCAIEKQEENLWWLLDATHIWGKPAQKIYRLGFNRVWLHHLFFAIFCMILYSVLLEESSFFILFLWSFCIPAKYENIHFSIAPDARERVFALHSSRRQRRWENCSSLTESQSNFSRFLPLCRAGIRLRRRWLATNRDTHTIFAPTTTHVGKFTTTYKSCFAISYPNHYFPFIIQFNFSINEFRPVVQSWTSGPNTQPHHHAAVIAASVTAIRVTLLNNNIEIVRRTTTKWKQQRTQNQRKVFKKYPHRRPSERAFVTPSQIEREREHLRGKKIYLPFIWCSITCNFARYRHRFNSITLLL